MKRGLLMAVILLAGGITLTILGLSSGASESVIVNAPLPTIAAPFSADDAVTYTGDTTAEPPLQPMELSVPSVGLRLSMVDTGLSPTGEMVLPASPLAAHYAPAAALGASEGSTVIAGHVDFSDGSLSPMGKLSSIQKGAPIFVSSASGTVYKYKAVDARLYSKKALPESFFQTSGDPQLVLITCGGDIGMLDGKLNYLENAAVVAAPWP